MPVRDTTAWRHAIIQKKVINHDRGGTHVMCAWDTCENDGYEMHRVRVQTHADNVEEFTMTPNGPMPNLRYMNYVFCSERHKMYFVNSIRDMNNLPAGYKRSIL
jgi:hypothetical protein